MNSTCRRTTARAAAVAAVAGGLLSLPAAAALADTPSTDTPVQSVALVSTATPDRHEVTTAAAPRTGVRAGVEALRPAGAADGSGDGLVLIGAGAGMAAAGAAGLGFAMLRRGRTTS
ncbi:hypothetical protein ACIQUQ_00945 [Streptomyces sp. NPDC101118]|uniref:hypothetical protein n=1 Tax=Streptomyces sp. NPDC101118 TaxID=3366109 RepID=UPI0037FE6239